MNQVAFDFTERSKDPDRFWLWLRDNGHINQAFQRAALSMAMTGRKRYSARTIIETIRWNTELADSEIMFKINNNYVPGLARLFMSKYGERFPGFFKVRNQSGFDE